MNHEQQTIVAIDFGTSNTVVSILDPQTKQPKTLIFPQISRLFQFSCERQEMNEVPVVPTLVFVKENERLAIGEEVRLQKLATQDARRLFKNFKRDLIADFQPLPRQIDGKIYSTQAIAEVFVREIYKHIKFTNLKIDRLILNVPVGAFTSYLDWFKNLGKSLNASSVTLVDESTAASLGYAIEHPNALVLAIDFGGGTLDISLVRTVKLNKENESLFKAEVLAKTDIYLGGEDINIWLVEDYLSRINLSRESIDKEEWHHLLNIAEQLKIQLSSQEQARENWHDRLARKTHQWQLNRQKLLEILEKKHLFKQLNNAIDEVLDFASNRGIDRQDIERVLLVGGTCSIPAIRNLIIDRFGREKVKFDKPFEAVCHGALAISKLTEIKDYLRHSYAIRLWQSDRRTYDYLILFEAGTSYPCCREEELILQVATTGQTEIRLDIGEVAQISQTEVSFDQFDPLQRMTSTQLLKEAAYRSLNGEASASPEENHATLCIAHLDPPGEIGIDRVAVKFEVNEQRILIATVRDLLTGKLLVNRKAIAKLQSG
ncbi:MAG: Hsp70 family protein [Xenococcaceae cyanobacterium]